MLSLLNGGLTTYNLNRNQNELEKIENANQTNITNSEEKVEFYRGTLHVA
jgi:hypothetical protein